MITLKTEKPTYTLNLDGSVNLTIKTKKSVIGDINNIKTDFVSVEIKEFHEKRTMSQNSYMWKLLNQLAEKYNESSEVVYRMFVKDYGVKDYICIQDKAVDQFIALWSKNGVGWFAEKFKKGKAVDTTTLVVYYGSSSYDTKQMVRLVQAVVDECEKVGIPTLAISEIKSLTNEND